MVTLPPCKQGLKGGDHAGSWPPAKLHWLQCGCRGRHTCHGPDFRWWSYRRNPVGWRQQHPNNLSGNFHVHHQHVQKSLEIVHLWRSRDLIPRRGWGAGTPTFVLLIGMCHCEGYCFQAVYSRIGYINQSVCSFFRKLISWWKILSRLGKQLL